MESKKPRISKHPSTATATMMTARIPPELCDMVVDFLHEDKDTLASCTLVSRSWLRVARYHLFDSIYVHCEQDPDTFTKFLVYLQTTPSIRAYIKDLCFDGYNEAPDLVDSLKSPYLAAVLALLPQVLTVSAINCQWGPSTLPSDAALVQQRQIPLRSLYINSFVADSESPRNKLGVLRHFSHIDHLHLANVWLGHFDVDSADMDKVGSEGSTDPLPATQVNILSLSMADICLNFLEYLRIQPFMKSLSSLRVIDLFHAQYLEEHQDLIFLGDLLRNQLGSTLQELHLELPRISSSVSADIYGNLNLSHCTALTSITLRMPCRREGETVQAETATQDQGTQVGEGADPQQADGVLPTAPLFASLEAAEEATSIEFSPEEWRVLVVILSQFPSSTRSISLDVELEGSAKSLELHLNGFPKWTDMENALVKLPNLEKVAIHRVTEDYPYIVEWTKGQYEAIRSKLPALRDKQLLYLN